MYMMLSRAYLRLCLPVFHDRWSSETENVRYSIHSPESPKTRKQIVSHSNQNHCIASLQTFIASWQRFTCLTPKVVQSCRFSSYSFAERNRRYLFNLHSNSANHVLSRRELPPKSRLGEFSGPRAAKRDSRMASEHRRSCAGGTSHVEGMVSDSDTIFSICVPSSLFTA